MKKNCEQIMNRFYGLDKNEFIPLSVSLHLLSCRECRTKVRILTKAEKLVAAQTNQKLNPESEEVQNIVSNAIKETRRKTKPVSFISWIFAGVLLFTIFIALSYYLKNQAARIQFALSLFTGLSFTFFVFGFLAANLDLFIKKVQKISRNHLLTL